MKRDFEKTIKYLLSAAIFLAVLYYLTIPMVLLMLCGLWDIGRNENLDAGVFASTS